MSPMRVLLRRGRQSPLCTPPCPLFPVARVGAIHRLRSIRPWFEDAVDHDIAIERLRLRHLQPNADSSRFFERAPNEQSR